MDKQDALSSLELIGATQRDLARAANCPPWRHAAFGCLMGGLVLSQGVAAPLSAIVQIGVLILLAAIFISDRRRMGMFINGYRKGATRPLTFVMLGLMLLLCAAEYHARASGLSPATRLALPLIAAALGTAMSVKWQRTFRREMGLD